MFKFHQETLVKNNWKCHFYKATYRNISSQDVSKSTYLTLEYISDEKCIKATSYIVSINPLV